MSCLKPSCNGKQYTSFSFALLWIHGCWTHLMCFNQLLFINLVNVRIIWQFVQLPSDSVGLEIQTGSRGFLIGPCSFLVSLLPVIKMFQAHLISLAYVYTPDLQLVICPKISFALFFYLSGVYFSRKTSTV